MRKTRGRKSRDAVPLISTSEVKIIFFFSFLFKIPVSKGGWVWQEEVPQLVWGMEPGLADSAHNLHTPSYHTPVFHRLTGKILVL